MAVLIPTIRKVAIRHYFAIMSQEKNEPFYKLYRNLPGISPSLASLFQNLDQSPDNPRCHFELGEVAHRVGLLELSAECFSKVTDLAPQVDAGHFNLGNALFDLQKFNKAKDAYERALHLKPDCGTLNNLGNCFAAMEEWENAIQTFDRAINSLDSNSEDTHAAFKNKGKALTAAGDWDSALENYRQAILRFPDDIGFLALKAQCHKRRYEFGKAMECLVNAIVVSPKHPELLCQIADINFSRGRAMESLLCLSQAFTIQPPPAALLSRWLRILTYCAPTTPQRMLNEAKCWATSLSLAERKFTSEPSVSSLATNTDSISFRALRLGILCSALPRRGLGDWLSAHLAHFDPATVQWFVFCDQPVNKTMQTELVRAGCRLEETTHLSDQDLASLINSRQLNVLIDMIGHGHGTRLQAIATRPAPVQVAWCAFPISSGLPQMDFIWSDEVLIPAESEKFFSEQVIRFPQSSFCFQPSCSIELKAKQDLAASPFCCGFLGTPDQITDAWVETASLVLASVPDAEIVFIGQAYRDPEFQAELRSKFEKQPAVPSRIRFNPVDSSEEELEAYQQLDVSLDSFYVSSPQRSFESLWMGVPVVTHSGDRFSGRGTASILHFLNRKAWIAKSQSDYIEAVKQLAENRRQVRSQRSALRDELLSSQMCNVEMMATIIQATIEHTLRQANAPFKSD